MKFITSVPGIHVVPFENPCGSQADQELLKAAEEGNLDRVLDMMPCPNVDFNAKNEKGMTPLYLASLRGHAEVVKALVRVPVVRDTINEPVVGQWTPLLSAASGGRAGVIKALLSAPGIDVNARFKARANIVARHLRAWEYFCPFPETRFRKDPKLCFIF